MFVRQSRSDNSIANSATIQQCTDSFDKFGHEPLHFQPNYIYTKNPPGPGFSLSAIIVPGYPVQYFTINY